MPRAQGQLVAERYSAAQRVTAATRLISWSLAKSVTSALLGVRTAEPGGSGFSERQLARSPVWNASEVAARNITREGPPLSPLLGVSRVRVRCMLWGTGSTRCACAACCRCPWRPC